MTITQLVNQSFDIFKGFGKKPEQMENIIDGFILTLGKYPEHKIQNGFQVYLTKGKTMPVPADIIEIIDPEPQKITTAEFIHAKEQHAAEGFPAYGYYGQIIKDYEAQNGEAREPSKDGPVHPQLKARVDAEIKRLENAKS